MLDFQQKRKIKKVIYSKTVLIILVVFVFLLLKADYEIFKKQSLSSQSLLETEKQFNNLKSRQEMLNSEISKLKTDSGIEREIRSKFDVAKPGETVVVIVEKNANNKELGTASALSFWQRFLNLFR